MIRWMAIAMVCALVPMRALGQSTTRFVDARDLLEKLEHVGDEIQTLQALLQYDRRFLLQGDRHIRRGTLAYKQFNKNGTPRRGFEVRFERLYLPMQQREEEDVQVWSFNGEWLIEIRPRQRVYTARQLALPDQPIDPLRLGEGPIPIPIGQRADDVLERYEAEMVPADDGLSELEEGENLRSFVKGSVQLHLRPKPDRAQDDDFRQIRLWYNQETLLPVMSVTENQSGDISVVQLLLVRMNEPLPEAAFSVEPPSVQDGWQVQIEPLEQPEPVQENE
jgi:hypothetical protein